MFRHLPPFEVRVKLSFSTLWLPCQLLTFNTLTAEKQLRGPWTCKLHNVYIPSLTHKEKQLFIIKSELSKIKDQNVLPTRYVTDGREASMNDELIS